MPSLQSLIIRAAVIAIVAVAGYGLGYWHAADNGASAREIAALQSQIAAAKADTAIARKAQEAAEQQATVLQALALDNQEMVDDLTEDALSRQKDRAACLLSDADAERLRKIR